MNYAIVTVKLNQPPMAKDKAFKEIKKVLKLADPDIQESYGAIPMPEIKAGVVCQKDEYIVLIEQNLAQKMKDGNHPNILGVFANPQIGPAGKGPGMGPMGPIC